MSLADIKRVFEVVVANKEMRSIKSPVLAWWGGYTWRLAVRACVCKQAGCSVAVYIQPQQPAGVHGTFFMKVRATLVVGSGPAKPPFHFMYSGSPGGIADPFDVGVRSTWDEEAWHNTGVVQGGKVKLLVRLEDLK